MDIIQIIDDLEQEFVNSKNFLWSKKTLVNMEKCASLIAELKASLPTAIQEARYVLSKKDELLSEAHKESEYILTETKKQVEHMVSSSEIAKRSEKYADELVDNYKYDLTLMNQGTLGEFRMMAGFFVEHERHSVN